MKNYIPNTLVAAKQPDPILTQQQDILKAAESYIAVGFCLVPIPYGEEGPTHRDWNRRIKKESVFKNQESRRILIDENSSR